MDFYCIPTLNNLELSLLGDRVFCLAHFYVRHNRYRRFFLELKMTHPNVFITLDNSAAEQSLVTEEVLLDIVEELRPNEVIAPDTLCKKDETIAGLNSFISAMKTRGLIRHTNIFGCPQGDRLNWLECYDYMLDHPDVSTIGLSKIGVPYAFLEDFKADQEIKEARHAAVDLLSATDRIQKPIHFLGMGDPTEFKHYKKYNNPLLRSSDSCYSVLAATEGILFEEDTKTRVVTTEEFYNKTLTAEEISATIRNMFFLKQYNNY